MAIGTNNSWWSNFRVTWKEIHLKIFLIAYLQNLLLATSAGLAHFMWTQELLPFDIVLLALTDRDDDAHALRLVVLHFLPSLYCKFCLLFKFFAHVPIVSVYKGLSLLLASRNRLRFELLLKGDFGGFVINICYLTVSLALVFASVTMFALLESFYFPPQIFIVVHCGVLASDD
jgi:hypothetical protein